VQGVRQAVSLPVSVLGSRPCQKAAHQAHARPRLRHQRHCPGAAGKRGLRAEAVEQLAGKASLKPAKQPYQKLQIDELWSYVGEKKRKRWFIYAYCPESQEIVAMVCGTRSAATVKKLYRKIKHLQVDWYCTDKWKAFAKVLPYERHLVGKKFTKAIEGVNTNLRTRNRRIMRKTTCFSKSETNHLYTMSLTVQYFNYHTF